MESISIRDRVAPIAKSPLDSARGRRRKCEIIRINEDEVNERLYELIRETQIHNIFRTASHITSSK